MSSHPLLPVSIAYALDFADPPRALLLLFVLTSHVNICKFISLLHCFIPNCSTLS